MKKISPKIIIIIVSTLLFSCSHSNMSKPTEISDITLFLRPKSGIEHLKLGDHIDEIKKFSRDTSSYSPTFWKELDSYPDYDEVLSGYFSKDFIKSRLFLKNDSLVMFSIPTNPQNTNYPIKFNLHGHEYSSSSYSEFLFNNLNEVIEKDLDDTLGDGHKLLTIDSLGLAVLIYNYQINLICMYK